MVPPPATLRQNTITVQPSGKAATSARQPIARGEPGRIRTDAESARVMGCTPVFGGISARNAPETDCHCPKNDLESSKRGEMGSRGRRAALMMDCIALVSFTHTHAATGRLFYGQASCLNGLHCACEFYTRTRTPPAGSRTNSRDHGRPIQRNGKPASKVARQLRLAILAILMASLSSACASNSSMRNQLPRRPAKPLGPLTTLPELSANSATPWRTDS